LLAVCRLISSAITAHMHGARLLEAVFVPRDHSLTPTASPAGSGARWEAARVRTADLHGGDVYREMLLHIFSACLSGE
jgi:hypothetical protein